MVLTPRLELIGITKRYPGVQANNNISLKVMPGEIHALLGENGAGKSTLVKCIYGVQKADSGTLIWEGKKTQVTSPNIARRLGIGMVFQHFSLFDAMTVEENIVLGVSNKLAKAGIKEKITEISSRYGLPLDPQRYVQTLSVGERQRIEVVRCLLQNPSLLIMDEPTSVLTPQETESLFKTLNQLSKDGVSILYISHKLHEIKELCHTATILRMGNLVDTCNPKNETPRSLAEKMMGKSLEKPTRIKNSPFGKPQILLNNLSYKANQSYGTDLKNISLEVRGGEILGIAGVAGNGQRELMKVLSGEELSNPPESIVVSEKNVGNTGPNDRRSLGMVFVPEERLGHGAVPQMGLSENAFLSGFTRMKLANYGFLRKIETDIYASNIITNYDVKTSGIRSLAASLSGGNLQKFIFGREIIQNPNIVIAMQPTWGVDAGSAAYIRQSLIDLAEQGAAVLVISQDLEELYEIVDTICVIYEGKLSSPKQLEDISTEEVGMLMGGVIINSQEDNPLNGI
ncbi:MAG: ABC transporter ATP-binding protein [Alphaproteobacteria bacterium]|nr:ABC transporter ATP-binding protein [Alphaproteobacteria bacterium]